MVYVLAGTTLSAFLGIALLRQQSNFHASSIRKQNEVIALQGANHRLGKSNHALALHIQADAAQLTHDAAVLGLQDVAICTALGIKPCPGSP